MSEPEVTEADREKARRLLTHAYCQADVCECGEDDEVGAIAAALAAERAKAREPFLALADDLDGDFEIHGFAVAEDIRRAAEETA